MLVDAWGGELMRAMHLKMADFDQIVTTLLTQGDIVSGEIPTKTKPAFGYQLVRWNPSQVSLNPAQAVLDSRPKWDDWDV